MGVREINDGEEFASLCDEWNGLVGRVEKATVFSTHEWLSSWWKFFGRGKRLRVLLATGEGGELAGGLPLAAVSLPVFRIPVLRALVLVGEGISDYGDLPATPGREEETAGAITDHLCRHEGRGWDIIRLAGLPQSSSAPTEMIRSSRRHRLSAWVEESEPTAYLELPPDYERFLAKLPPNLRRTLARTGRRLEREPGARLICHTGEEGLAGAMDDLFRLHQMRQSALNQRGAFADEVTRSFHREVARLLARRGWLRLHFLELDGKRVGVMYGFLYRGVLYAYLLGFDPAYAKYSPGTMALGSFIKEGIEAGARLCDLMRGGEAYKTHWGALPSRNRSVMVVRHPGRFGLYRRLSRMRAFAVARAETRENPV